MSLPRGLRIADEVDSPGDFAVTDPYRLWLIRLSIALAVVLCFQLILAFLQGEQRQGYEREFHGKRLPEDFGNQKRLILERAISEAKP
jgi:hypothetical protein